MVLSSDNCESPLSFSFEYEARACISHAFLLQREQYSCDRSGLNLLVLCLLQRGNGRETSTKSKKRGREPAHFVECSPFADFAPTVASSQEARRLLTEDFVVTHHRIFPGRCTSQE